MTKTYLAKRMVGLFICSAIISIDLIFSAGFFLISSAALAMGDQIKEFVLFLMILILAQVFITIFCKTLLVKFFLWQSREANSAISIAYLILFICIITSWLVMIRLDLL